MAPSSATRRWHDPGIFGAADSVEDLFAEAHRTGRIRRPRLALPPARPSPPRPGPAGSGHCFLNVSAIPLLDPVHPVDQMLLLVLEASEPAPSQLVLELTEREMVVGHGPGSRRPGRLPRPVGFRFALDDVGEGHSTLELLAAARPEFIKIARSLTMTASHSSSRAAIRAALAFAQVSGAAVIAEGIENEFAAAQMIAMGVALGQGMWLGRPGGLDRPHGERLMLGKVRPAITPVR